MRILHGTSGKGVSRKLLLVLPVPFVSSPDGGLMIEAQALNGLRLWAENFEQVTVMAPLAEGRRRSGWRPAEELGATLARVRLIPLPAAYRADRFLLTLGPSVRAIRREIHDAQFLCFAIGGLFGDWGSIACLAAMQMKRPYAVWTDRVQSAVVRHAACTASGLSRLRARLTHRPMAALERLVIRGAGLGLFHGRETFDHYSMYNAQSQMVHNIHLGRADHISPLALEWKISGVDDSPLRIIYVGRADPMKGPADWLETLHHLHRRGVRFEAEWLGSGLSLDALRRGIAKLGLQECVAAPGHVEGRSDVLEKLRQAHVFLFCHKTPESPRCLIEALVSGTPICGYDGAFACDLISDAGGGCLTPMNDPERLAEAVARLAEDRGALKALIRAAYRDGSKFDDVSVFRHRSDLIKQYLSPPEPAQGSVVSC